VQVGSVLPKGSVCWPDPSFRMSRPKKGVFFDAGGTLFEVAQSVGFHYSRYAEQFGVAVDADWLNLRFAEVMASAPPLTFPEAQPSEVISCERQWWYNVVRAVFESIPFPEFDRFFEAVYHFFSQAEAWSLFPETIEVLSVLSQRNFVLGIVSNFDSRLPTLCKALGIAHFFRTITYSSRAGQAKPSPEIFITALRQVGIHPVDILYVGDHPEHDLPGPRSLGMTTLLLDRTGRHATVDALRISQLSGLFKYLEPIGQQIPD